MLQELLTKYQLLLNKHLLLSYFNFISESSDHRIKCSSMVGSIKQWNLSCSKPTNSHWTEPDYYWILYYFKYTKGYSMEYFIAKFEIIGAKE